MQSVKYRSFRQPWHPRFHSVQTRKAWTMMVLGWLAVAAASFLSGCSTPPRVDSYPGLTIIRMDRPDMQKACYSGQTTDKGGLVYEDQIEGCYNKESKTIYLDRAGRAIYHELAHFFCGDDADCHRNAYKHDDPAPVYSSYPDTHRGRM